jgi:hypothetical protein
MIAICKESLQMKLESVRSRKSRPSQKRGGRLSAAAMHPPDGEDDWRVVEVCWTIWGAELAVEDLFTNEIFSVWLRAAGEVSAVAISMLTAVRNARR